MRYTATVQATIALTVLALTTLAAAGCAQMRILTLTVQSARLDAAGRHEEALRAARDALAIVDRYLPRESRWSMMMTEDLARGYEDISDYTRAEALYERLLEVREKVRGPEHRDTATTLEDLADVYYKAAEYRRAESFYQRALEIREKVLGPEHTDTADSLLSLGQINIIAHDYARAERLIRRALEIYTSARGADHIETAYVLQTLGTLYVWMGSYSQAEPLLKQSLAICEKRLDPDDIEVSSSLASLASAYAESGRYAEARPLYERALAIHEKWLGSDHPATGALAYALSHVLMYVGDLDSAGSVARKVDRVRLAEMRTMLSFGSEQQRLLFQLQRDPYAPATALGDPDEIATIVLRFKGIVLDSVLEDRRLARSSGDAAQLDLLRELRSVKQQRLSVALARTEVAREQSKFLQDRVAQIEKRLARDDQDGARARQGLSVVPEQVQAALASDAVLVEFLRYRLYPGGREKQVRYGAVVLSARGKPRWVALGSGASIEDEVARYQRAMREARPPEEIDKSLRELYEKVWAPLESVLPPGTKRVVVSPDGMLNLVSFATLLAQDGSFLVEHYTLSYAASGRDLLVAPAPTTSSEMIIYANPDFGSIPEDIPSTSTVEPRSPLDAEVELANLRQIANLQLGPLPGTGREGERLARQARSAGRSVVHLEGREATETMLRRVSSPRVLHIATHGFFIADPSTPPSGAAERGVGGVRPFEPMQAEPQTPQSSIDLVDPMLRSALALSGAQHTLAAWMHGEIPATDSDGIVMADEVAMLDLTGTWLVTLSTCDSGMGAIRSGEGVLGLRRGFSQAGAQNLLMALWPVSDRQTVDFMIDFYAALETQHATPADALAHVQRNWLVRKRTRAERAASVRIAGPFVVSILGSSGVQ